MSYRPVALSTAPEATSTPAATSTRALSRAGYAASAAARCKSDRNTEGAVALPEVPSEEGSTDAKWMAKCSRWKMTSRRTSATEVSDFSIVARRVTTSRAAAPSARLCSRKNASTSVVDKREGATCGCDVDDDEAAPAAAAVCDTGRAAAENTDKPTPPVLSWRVARRSRSSASSSSSGRNEDDPPPSGD